MKLPRNLSGHDLAATLCQRWGYLKVNQVGSHVILQTQDPTPHRVAVPIHQAMRVGALNGILRSVANHKALTVRRFSIPSVEETPSPTLLLPASASQGSPTIAAGSPRPAPRPQ